VKPQIKQITVELRSGRLQLETQAARIPLRRLLGFASRINSKRGFLFISKVLGKHYPVTPRKMAWSYRALAKQILQQTGCSGNASLWVGMAETATGLGYGIYQAAYALGLSGGLFMQTTRYQLAGFERIDFVETHSHAADFSLYWPTDPTDRQCFLQAEQLVLMDDEISTGATFSRLIAAYRLINPQLKSVVIASLVNFASTEHRRQVEQQAGIPVLWIYLLQGQWQFEPFADAPAAVDDNVNVIGNGECKKNILAWPGRLGIKQPICIGYQNIAQLWALLPQTADNRPILVLGTGECNPPAYLLGRYLEQQGLPVIVQATTRSPIFVEGDIGSCIQFSDNYQDNIHNFLYNINPDDFRLIIFCHETPLFTENLTGELDFIGVIKQWQAVSAQFLYQGGQDAEFIFCRPG